MWYPVSGLTAMELLKDNVLPTYSWICSDWEIYWDHHGHFEQIQVWTLFLANHSKKHQSISPWTADKFLWKLAHGLSLSPSSYGSFTAVSWTFYRLFRLWVLERSWGFLIIAISNLEDFLVVRAFINAIPKRHFPKTKFYVNPGFINSVDSSGGYLKSQDSPRKKRVISCPLWAILGTILSPWAKHYASLY